MLKPPLFDLFRGSAAPLKIRNVAYLYAHVCLRVYGLKRFIFEQQIVDTFANGKSFVFCL